jgi:hypothetical protein
MTLTTNTYIEKLLNHLVDGVVHVEDMKCDLEYGTFYRKLRIATNDQEHCYLELSHPWAAIGHKKYFLDLYFEESDTR